jgi:mono/diheme cytochrome c family protein
LRFNAGTRFFGLIILFIGLGLLQSCAVTNGRPQPEENQPNSTPQINASAIVFPLVPPDPANGEILYQQNCTGCHGLMGEQTPVNSNVKPFNAAAIQNAVPSSLYKVISNGEVENGMHSFSDLATQERWDIVSYLLINQPGIESLNNASLMYENLCQSCHGGSGKGDGEQATKRMLQIADWSKQELLVDRSNAELETVIRAGTNNGMPKFGIMLGENEIASLASFIRTFSINPASLPSIINNQPLVSEQIQPSTPPFYFDITGSVTNASEAEKYKDQPVILRIYENELAVSEKNTTTDKNGNYRFTRVEWNALWTYQTTTLYDGIYYPSRIVEAIGLKENDVIDLPLVTYEKTTDARLLEGERLRLTLDFSAKDWILVSQSLLFSNPSKMTVVPADEEHPVVDFHLPTGFIGLRYYEANTTERFIQTRKGVGDWQPVLPGMSHQLMLDYTLPFDEYRLIDLTIPLSTDSLMVEIVDPVGRIVCKTARMTSIETPVKGVNVAFTLHNLLAGEKVVLECSSNSSTIAGPILISVLAAATLLLGGWSLIRARKSSNSRKIKTEVELKSEKDEILDQIIALDDRYKAGDLNVDVYRAKRADFVRQVEELEEKQ